MRAGETNMPRRDSHTAPDLTEALCAGDTTFTSDRVGRVERARLIATCNRCPVLDACAQDRDRWRIANHLDWQQFSGVWAGKAYSKGQPWVGTGYRR